MKTTLLACLFVLVSINLFAQQSPEWLKQLVGPNDSTIAVPVKTLTNYNDNTVLVLCNNKTDIGQGNYSYKISLTKFSEDGSMIWNNIYDNGQWGMMAYDMLFDSLGMCYIAGSSGDDTHGHGLLMKVRLNGSIVWKADTIAKFNNAFNNVYLNYGQLYLISGDGVAAFDLNGNNKWADLTKYYVLDGATDTKGRLLTILTDSAWRYERNGTKTGFGGIGNNLKIKTDYEDNIYILSGTSASQYILYKLNSNGTHAWDSGNLITYAPPFGGDTYNLMVDYEENILVTGLQDTMYRFSTDGNLIWKKSMDDLGQLFYMGPSATALSQDNFLVVSGIKKGQDFVSNDDTVVIRLYNRKGDISWEGIYNRHLEPTFSQIINLAFNGDGIYILENANDTAVLAKFDSPFGYEPDFTQFCVDSVWYDATPGLINVRVFNGSTGFINYPSVQIVSPGGDTIANKSNRVNFFGQLANTYQVYTDSISQTGITDFSNYTFVLNEGFGDTSNAMYWCAGSLGTKHIKTIEKSELVVYPNPVQEQLYIHTGAKAIATVYNCTGIKMLEQSFNNASLNSIDVTAFTPGIYIMQLQSKDSVQQVKFVKQ